MKEVQDRIIKVCRIIETSQEEPALEKLAEAAHLSPYHFLRVFREAVGVTPKQYAVAVRDERMRELLARGMAVTEALYEAGFGSGSSFYSSVHGILGMTPASFRSGGKGAVIQYAFGTSFLGDTLVAATDRGICAIEFGERRELLEGLQHRFPKAELREAEPAFRGWVAAVTSFIDSPDKGEDLPLDIQGTAFQKRVWQTLRQVPPGETMTYGELAERMGIPKAVRAVAGACGANRLGVVVPCHRIMGRDGKLRGYRWGVERKMALIERERLEIY
ncbi:methylated-DNA--[protein]-cysteine S-methyltransferase [Salidesulfovibrio onnuriiensis]|uniref:methylated-DNA--[protein]-cysteine S-methyltransferase n=1 Tax=Salidesulfovibrio onnuriiensis TaxID=2583823 RepID=UPI0016500353|nr:methylated-DNA--[protein]-cysteine S-methyltransferase [Salidesulfovibrio onnuriiensis]